MTVSSYVVPNLIQGISQQAPEQRRVSQCEDQQNCFNSPKDGVVARPSLDVIKGLTDFDFSDAAFYEILRGGVVEHYLVVIYAGNEIKVFNLADGAEATVTIVGSPLGYLDSAPYTTRQGFRFQTIDDYTFILNRSKVMAFTSAVQTTRPPEALVFVKAGGYSQQYTIAIYYSGNLYKWDYTTPDNSVATNAPFISTAQIAATFYKAMTGTSAPVYPSGGAAPSDFQGVGGMYGGDAGTGPGSHGTVAGAITATSLGFSMEIRGNVLRIWRNSDSNPFLIDAGDSVGGTFMSAIKGTVQSLADLPQKAFQGFRVKVAGTKEVASVSGYYLEFTDKDVWEETIADGESTTLDPATMPHALINTGVNTFTFGAVNWDLRIVGDIKTSPAPYFVGRSGEDLFFFNSRLGILTEGFWDTTRTRNSFNFFRDTVQTILATDPVSVPVQGAQTIALARRAVLADESLFIWAQQAQFRVDSGTQPFQSDTVTNKPSTAHTFAEDCKPYVNGSSLYFAIDPGDYVAINNLIYSGGKAAAPLDLTTHVPDLIPTGIIRITGSDTHRVLFALTEGDPSSLYVYNYVLQGAEVIQSAWNVWRFPGVIKWASVVNNLLYVGLQRTGQFVLCKLNLTLSSKDPSGTAYQTRLDLRLPESQFTSRSYDAITKQTTIVVPLNLTDEIASQTIAAAVRSGTYRGVLPEIVWASSAGSTIVLTGDWSTAELYLGVLIDSWMDLSEFFPRSNTGEAQMLDGLTIREVLVSHTESISYDAIVTSSNGDVQTHHFSSRTDGNLPTSMFGTPIPAKGKHRVPIGERSEQHTIRLRNNTPFPSRWQRLRYTYEAFNRGASDPSA